MKFFEDEDELEVQAPYEFKNPQVKDYISQKYSPEARKAIENQNASDASGPNFLAGLAALGAGLQGGNAVSAGQSFLANQQAQRDKKLTQFDSGRKLALEEETLARDREKLARENDLSSSESQLAQSMAIQMGVKPELASKLTASKLKEQFPFLQKKFDIEQKNLDRAETRADRAQQAALNREARSDALQMKREEKMVLNDEKKKAVTNEVEQRRQDIRANLDLVKKQIQDKGTYEMFGSHNQDIERRLDAVATDMAKLMDPTSVARPAEVESIKQNLVKAGFKNSNETALKILDNFAAEVDDRADNAYRIRGLDKPMIAARPEKSSESVASSLGNESSVFDDAKKARLAELRAKRSKGVAQR